MMLWVSVILTFLLVLSINLLVYNAATSRRRSIAQRIVTHTTYPQGRTRQKVSRFRLKGLFKSISRIFVSRNLAVKAEADLIKAGIPLSGEEGLMLWLLLLVIPAALTLILTHDLQKAILLMALVGSAPFFILRNLVSKRIETFNRQVCDALVIMANSLRAGFSFLQAVEMVSREMTDPIATEFRRVLREMHLGVPTEQALINMGERVGSKDLDLIVTAILIQRQVGGNLAEVLINISDTIRGRFQLAREVRVLTAQGRISGLIIGLLPVILTMFLYFINKDYILTLFSDSRGLILVGMGVFAQVIGLMFIKRIVNVQM